MPGACDMLKGSTVLMTFDPAVGSYSVAAADRDDPGSTAFYHETDTSVA